jgi:eukaryotic-like serine/threonine-protein kinase
MSPAGHGLLADRYQLDDRIAIGGFGEVWRSTDTVLARPVAVKLLQSGYAHEPGTVARFRAEARHAGSLTHEGIARVYDYGEPAPPQPPFLVLELVDGPSLAALLARGPLGPAQVMDLVAQAAAGLHAAHQTGLVHRDIKPGNLLISPGGVVKITDFGISHAAGSAPLTDTGQLVGTAGYLAPERAAGDHGSAASDLYSLGVVAYECLTGTLPFTGGPLQMALAHLDRPMPPLPPDVPADVADLVGRLTAKDAEQRPATAGEVAEAAARLRDRLIREADGLAGDPGCARVALSHRPHADSQQTDRWPPGPQHAGPQCAGPPYVAPLSTDARPTGPQPTVPPPTGSRRPDPHRPGGRRRGWHKAALAGLGAAAALLAVTLASLGSPAPQHRAAAVPSSTSAPHASKAALIRVNAAMLTGRPVSTVRSELRQLGLAVQVQWQPARGGAPGTVRSVHPVGWLPAGSTVVVTGVLVPTNGGADHHRHSNSAPPGHNQGQDQGNGQGKHHGRGKGHGQGGQPPEGDTSLAAAGTSG